jgi:nitrate reductase gamma subunit
MNNFSDTIGNRTCDLPACSAVPQPTAPPCVPVTYIVHVILTGFAFHYWLFSRNLFPSSWTKAAVKHVRVSHGSDYEEYVFRDMTICSLVEVKHCLGGAYCFHCLHFWLYNLVDFSQIMWCDSSEGNICQQLNNPFLISVCITFLTLVMCRIMRASIMFHEGFSVEEGCGLSLLQAHISYCDFGVIIVVICFCNTVSST